MASMGHQVYGVIGLLWCTMSSTLKTIRTYQNPLQDLRGDFAVEWCHGESRV